VNESTIGMAVFGVLSAPAVALAGAAGAAPTAGASASDTVKALHDMGYAVQLNGAVSGPLSMCTITGVHGLSNTDAAGNQIVPDQFNTAYVDVDCPADN
jgi:hypothetical protein